MSDYVDLQSAIKTAYEQLAIDDLVIKNRALQQQIQAPDFWSDNLKAQKISKEASALDLRITFWKKLKVDADDLVELAGLQDDSLTSDVETQYTQVKKTYEKARRELQFSGPYDASDVIVSIFAGAGGTDAQDWAQMLLRMYTRWAETEGMSITTIDQSSGDEAGIKSATLEFSGGSFLYGKLQAEHGVHRLVRLSPFNSDNLRQTSFARIEVMPKIDSPDQIAIDENDLKIDVYRSGGKGGQSVNTTDSAVRITHLPTNIVVAIQNERSQLQNRETAMTILRSRLAKLQLEQHKDKISELRGPNEQAAWGNQIRNYVLHPYTMVKDTRTKHESSDAQSVLDGDIDGFIEAYLDSLM
jgi:peptide chain release factor 2